MEQFRTGFVPGTPRLAYSEAGSGVPLIFLHGIGGNRRNWLEQLPAVAAQFRAIAWDARGYGDSEDYAEPLNFTDFAADLGRLLDHLQAPAAHLVGLSMGGRIILDFHEQAPARVLSLGLINTFPGYDEAFTPAAREKFIELRRKPLLEGKEPRDIAPTLARTLVSSCATPAHLAALVDSISRLHKESYIKALEAMTRYTRVAELARIRVPSLIVVGDQDRLTPPSVARGMAAAITGSELVVLRHAGHLSNLEQPALFNQVLLEFLTRV